MLDNKIMGGTKEKIEQTQAISKAWSDFNTIHFYVYYSGKGNLSLFNQDFYIGA